MKNYIIEETVLFVSIFKWIVLASGIGMVIGATTTIFIKALELAIISIQAYSHYYFFLPLGLFLSAVLIKYVAQEAKGYGTEKVIEAIHKKSGKINIAVIPVKILATILTASAGGSVGQIGPCAQIGGGVASFFSGILKLDENDRKKLVICGISAGFASVLGAPVAGAIFGVEVLFVGSILYEVLLPSFIAGIVGYHTASLLGITYFHDAMQIIPALTEAVYLKILLAGIFFGLCAIVVIETTKHCDLLFQKWKLWAPFLGLIGGVLMVILTLLLSTRYLGLGLDTVREALQGGSIPFEAPLMKTIFTAITFSSGGSGGIIAPILFIGASAGSLFGDISGLDRATFAAIGFVSVLAGAANTPIAMSILAIELFGQEIGSYAAVACIISFLITGHRSIFPTQMLAMKKSSSVEVELGMEMDHVNTHLKVREKSLIGKGIRIVHRIKRMNKQ